jgi:transposase
VKSKGDGDRIRAYVGKGTGLSVAQSTRLIRQYGDTGMALLQPSLRVGCSRKYTGRDIALLTETGRVRALAGPPFQFRQCSESVDSGHRSPETGFWEVSNAL